MVFYYTALQSRAHAFLLERRMKSEGVECELAFMPRPILRDLCNLGVKFKDSDFQSAVRIIRQSGLPGIKVYKETIYPNNSQYTEIII
ncbi:MAG: DUF3343 domain-containing protein [Clostridia bacterium]|nr:DUF3343 domain-containing protein [Clostridia bacterium]